VAIKKTLSVAKKGTSDDSYNSKVNTSWILHFSQEHYTAALPSATPHPKDCLKAISPPQYTKPLYIYISITS
jgi:hypothetical protein